MSPSPAKAEHLDAAPDGRYRFKTRRGGLLLLGVLLLSAVYFLAPMGIQLAGLIGSTSDPAEAVTISGKGGDSPIDLPILKADGTPLRCEYDDQMMTTASMTSYFCPGTTLSYGVMDSDDVTDARYTAKRMLRANLGLPRIPQDWPTRHIDTPAGSVYLVADTETAVIGMIAPQAEDKTWVYAEVTATNDGPVAGPEFGATLTSVWNALTGAPAAPELTELIDDVKDQEPSHPVWPQNITQDITGPVE